VGALLVVEGQISPNSPPGLSPVLVSLQVHILVLDAAPQPFYEDIVHAPALAVHADLNALRQQPAGKGVAGELAALVGVEDLRPTPAQGLFQGLNTEVHIQSVGQPPGQHVAAVPVHDGHQVQEAPGHGYVGDVGGRHLVDPVDLQPSQQVGIDFVPKRWLAGVGTPVDGFQGHHLHQPPDPLEVDLVSLLAQPGGHPSGAVEWCLQILTVHQCHQLQVLGTGHCGPVLQGGAADTQQGTLTHQGQMRVSPVNHGPALGTAHSPDIRDKKSRSTLNWLRLRRTGRVGP